MPGITLTLNAEDAWKDWHAQGRKFIQLDRDEPLRVGLLKGGMASGARSVSIGALMEDGRVCFVETSLALFLGAADAFRARVEAEKAGRV